MLQHYYQQVYHNIRVYRSSQTTVKKKRKKENGLKMQMLRHHAEL